MSYMAILNCDTASRYNVFTSRCCLSISSVCSDSQQQCFVLGRKPFPLLANEFLLYLQSGAQNSSANLKFIVGLTFCINASRTSGHVMNFPSLFTSAVFPLNFALMITCEFFEHNIADGNMVKGSM